MPECRLIGGCIFFNDKMADMPATAELYKNRYCREDSTQCARFRVCEALGREKVPGDLFPNQREKAEEIMNKA